MPPRSPWMKRRILGFQRRVWCPKCTPDSSSSLMPTSAMESPFGCELGTAPGGVGVGRTRLTAPGRAASLELPRWDRPGRWWKMHPAVYASSLGPPRSGPVRAGPPFPYLRWSGPQSCGGGGAAPPPPPLGGRGRGAGGGGAGGAPPAASQRRGQILRERRADVDPLAGDRVVEREPLRVQELALEAEAAGVAVLGVARHRM